MSQQQDQYSPEPGEPESTGQQQQQPQPACDGHGGCGSDSAMKQLRVWERERASITGNRRRNGGLG